MIKLKNSLDISRIKESSKILTETFKGLEKLIDEGVTTLELDAFTRHYITSKGARPAFLGYLNYPAALCVSINEEVIHGIPSKRKLKNGDLVSLDCGVELSGYFSDAAFTIGVGEISGSRKRLLKITEESLYNGIRQAVIGNRVSDISQAIYKHAKENNMEVVRQYCGHGVGFSQHEDPQIPNYVNSGPNPRLKAGMVIALEPMFTTGTWEVKLLNDNWTVVTTDGKDSAHFEHTIVVLKDRTEILTSFNSKN